MKSLLFIFSFILIFSCSGEKKPNSLNEHIPFLTSFDQLSPRFYNQTDTTYLVNFWATSCPPCIKEMPLFKQLEEVRKEDAFKVLLVSLDLPRDYENRVIPFVEKHEITPEVVHLADENYTYWTEKIDSSWFGALPATMVVHGNEKYFHFGAISNFQELDSIVNLLD